MPKPALKRIHVNQHVIRRNLKLEEDEPPIRIKSRGQNIAADRVEIDGPSELVYRPQDPLSCGARLWIETRSALNLEVAGERRRLD